MTVLNMQKGDDCPLFLGEDLGLQTYLNPRYPEIYKLFKDQRSQQWVETEVDLSIDQRQWVSLPEEVKQITVLNLANQVMMDSLLGRSPMRALAPFITNEEYEIAWLEIQRMEGAIHSVTYSHIIQSVFPNPDEVLEEIKKNAKALKRLEGITSLFDELYKQSIIKQYEEDVLGQEWCEEKNFELKKLILKTITACYILESIQFNASFSMTFALAEQDILPGIANELMLIAKDELGIHTEFGLTSVNIQRKVWPEVWGAIQHEVVEYFTEVYENEAGWGEYVLSEGRKVVGMNGGLIREYLQFVTTNSMQKLGLPVPEGIYRSKNPIPWIENWIDVSKIQSAPQEQEILNYKFGKIDNELDVSKLSFEL